MRKALKVIVIIIVIFGTVFNLNILSYCQSIKKTPVIDKKLNLRGNLINGGYAAETSEFIFYSNSDIGLVAIS